MDSTMEKGPQEEPSSDNTVKVVDDPIVASRESADLAERPEIRRTGAEFHDLVDRSKIALTIGNRPPIVFTRGGHLVEVAVPSDGDTPPFLSRYSDASLQTRMSRTARWTSKDGAAHPLASVAKAILAETEYPGIPVLNRIVTAPVYGSDGSLGYQPGYNESSRSYLIPHDDYGGESPIDLKADSYDTNWAATFLREEYLRDFPFDTPASKAHAVGLLLLPFVRELIDGPTPLHVIEAPTQGTGKTKLADALLLPALGTVGHTSPPKNEAEWGKTIAAKLSSGPGAIFFDNVRGRIEGQSLEAAITSNVYEDRILGTPKIGRWPVRNAWVATLNNAELGKDMVRRSVRIRLDAGVEHPSERSGFLHPDLLGWAAERRASLVATALTLCQAWVNEDMPCPGEAVPKLSDFPEWRRVIGGILGVAGFDGFLGNHAEMREETDDESSEWAVFLMEWEKAFGSDGVLAKDLKNHLTILPNSDLTSALPLAAQSLDKIGHVLRGKKNAIFGGRKLVSEGIGSNPKRWRVVHVP